MLVLKGWTILFDYFLAIFWPKYRKKVKNSTRLFTHYIQWWRANLSRQTDDFIIANFLMCSNNGALVLLDSVLHMYKVDKMNTMQSLIKELKTYLCSEIGVFCSNNTSKIFENVNCHFEGRSDSKIKSSWIGRISSVNWLVDQKANVRFQKIFPSCF